ncbi:unnamed protein product [Pneumocystis jirovecii]|uniref:Transmembrane protein n=1 Tax=Pneumocystis jirovecii TaxID=42068 RepID=L0PEW8_PNEJI|nr:unnamed protein product [Pneumocystis jirovecii]
MLCKSDNDNSALSNDFIPLQRVLKSMILFFVILANSIPPVVYIISQSRTAASKNDDCIGA